MPKSESADAEFDARFVAEYLKDLNATAAARRAGAPGADSTTSTRGYRMMQRPEIVEEIRAANAERMAVVKVEAQEVLRHVLATATVDPNEIVQIRRGCCRHCHGAEGRYQYVDQRELNRARAEFLNTTQALVEEFEHGGSGFDGRKPPREDCVRCLGEGSAYVYLADTRSLSPAARSLFAAAKQTKDGIEVKLHPQDKARELLMRHLGLLNDKIELTGDLADRILKARKRAGGGG